MIYVRPDRWAARRRGEALATCMQEGHGVREVTQDPVRAAQLFAAGNILIAAPEQLGDVVPRIVPARRAHRMRRPAAGGAVLVGAAWAWHRWGRRTAAAGAMAALSLLAGSVGPPLPPPPDPPIAAPPPAIAPAPPSTAEPSTPAHPHRRGPDGDGDGDGAPGQPARPSRSPVPTPIPVPTRKPLPPTPTPAPEAAVPDSYCLKLELLPLDYRVCLGRMADVRAQVARTEDVGAWLGRPGREPRSSDYCE